MYSRIERSWVLARSAQDSDRYQLSDEQVAEVDLAKQEVRAGLIATDDEMIEVWRRFGC
jgi:hypothetical protein